MDTVFIDVETPVSKTMTIRKMGLRQYLAAIPYILCLSAAFNQDEPVTRRPTDSDWEDFLNELHRLAESPHVRFAAHNWSFDGRVMTHKLGLPYPQRAVCTIEAAMCAWPNQPGGYSLANLAETLHLPSGKKLGEALDVGRMSSDELARYCEQDVRLCRDIYTLAGRRIPECEWAVGEMCGRSKECWFHVDGAAVSTAVAKFIDMADTSASQLAAVLEDEDSRAFGIDDGGHVKSVKPHEVKRLLLDHLGFQTQSISTKKVDNVALAQHEGARVAIGAAAATNKALSHRRRVQVFTGASVVDAELNWYAAHTGRSASRAVGKGLNLLNMPKHDPEVSKLFRSMFRLPAELCFVRADEMNVEYRVTGLVTGAHAVRTLFTQDVFADPYSAFGTVVTGKPITKADPIRQLFKMAVLGLGYGMGLELWCRGLLAAMAKPKPDFKLADLVAACEANRWAMPSKAGHAKSLIRKLGCDQHVVIAAYHTRLAFHTLHPEFGQVSRWLMQACEEASRGASQAAVDGMYLLPGAPSREYIQLEVTHDFEGVSLRVWSPATGWGGPAVTWRDLAVRDVPLRGVCLSLMSGAKGYRAMSPSIAIENVVQAVSRIRTVQAKLALADEYPYLFDVHDELLPVVESTPEAVIRARQRLLDVLGPHTRDPWGWAVAINPNEINVSRSWYEVAVEKLIPAGMAGDKPTNADWWRLLPDHPEFLENLP